MENKVSFKVSARTAILMGRENVANSEGAIIELIKNCYDADSDNAYLIFDNDTLIILDDGEGMNDDVIRNKWMVIGTDNKINDYITKKGRIKSGAKGIGRLALDKLGAESKVITSQGITTYCWEIKWEDFEKTTKTIDEIKYSLDELNLDFQSAILAEIQNDKIKEFLKIKKLNKGTFIKISLLREEWNDEKKKKLYEGLENLIPAGEENNFKLKVFFEENFKEVFFREIIDFDYKLNVKVVEGLAEIELTRREVDLNRISDEFFLREKIKRKDITTENFNNFKQKKELLTLVQGNITKEELEKIGDFEFELFFIKKQVNSSVKKYFPYISINTNIRAYILDKYSGVKIFRDNFRIRPYGEKNSASYDWLSLGERQYNNPAAVSREGGGRFAPGNIIGTVKISRVKNKIFEDKSSREGISETKYFDKFKNVLIKLIEYVERDRSLIFSELKEEYNSKNLDETVIEIAEKIILKSENEKLRNKNSNEDNFFEKIKNYYKSPEQNKALDKEIEDELLKIVEERKTLLEYSRVINEKQTELMDENALLRTYASSGIMLSSLSHEIKNIICKESSGELDFLENMREEYEETFSATDNEMLVSSIKKLQKNYNTVESWVNFSLNLVKKDKRCRKNVSLNEFSRETMESWKKILEKYKAELEIHITEEINYRCYKSDFESIVVNLIVNSVDAFQKKGHDRERKIKIDIFREDKNKIIIKYKDTGPGLAKEIEDPYDILQTNYSTPKNSNGEIGTGMGMHIIKTIVDSYDGVLELPKQEEGFEVKFTFIDKYIKID